MSMRLHTSDRARHGLSLLIAGAIVAVALQVCLMTGCTSMLLGGGYQLACHTSVPVLGSVCTMVDDPGALPAVLTYSAVMLVAFVAALVVSGALPSPSAAHARRARRVSGAPPGPPDDDPFGKRLRL